MGIVTVRPEESHDMGSYPGIMHDPDIDGFVKLPPKPVPMTRVPWLLAAVAFMSVAWAAVSIVLFLRAERSRRGP